ncbi:fluoride efflux transporter CrcB [Clostridium sp.]|jgi:CrcB protein|uniref:fluoride efflux transporter CrcB n=1 Tax=Clostridium sp. TaxID=1506 RepID=UPI003EEBFA73
MRKYALIAMGGMLGAMLRYFIKNIHIYPYKEFIPINTLFINISGSFVLALTLTVAFEIYEFDADLKLGLATGFLGAYTTFSTLCKQTVNLMNEGYYYSSISYIGFSAIFGFASAYLGVALARKIVLKLTHHHNNADDVQMEEAKGDD